MDNLFHRAVDKPVDMWINLWITLWITLKTVDKPVDNGTLELFHRAVDDAPGAHESSLTLFLFVQTESSSSLLVA